MTTEPAASASETVSDGAAVADGAAVPDATAGRDGAADAPEIGIVVPHYDDPARLARCLEALAAGGGLDGAEIVVVDNASPRPPAPPPAALRARLRLAVETARGAAMSRNRGVAETSAPYLLFLDADCVPAPGWLAAARAALPRLSAPGGPRLIGGRVDVFDETPPPRSGAEAFEAVFAFDNRRYVEREGFSVTANLLTTRAVFEAVGGFRAGVSEDLDWCRRAVAAGHPIAYEPALAVGHPARQDWPALARKWRRLTDEAWGVHLSGRAPGMAARVGASASWAGRALLMPASVLAHLPRVARSRALDGWGERARAAATLARLRGARMGWMLAQAAGRA